MTGPEAPGGADQAGGRRLDPTAPARRTASARRTTSAGRRAFPGAVSLNSSSRARQASLGPPSEYRIRSSVARPGDPNRSRVTRTSVRCPTMSRPSRIHACRLNSSRSAAICEMAPVIGDGSPGGSRTSIWTPARRARAVRRWSRSAKRGADHPAGSSGRFGRSSTRRSTVRSWRSIAAIASASSSESGVMTTNQSSWTPRATASTGSRLRARSRYAAIPPATWVWAIARNARVVLPLVSPPRRAVVATRGRPPRPRIASSALNPVEIARSSSGVAGRPGCGTSSGVGCGAIASAPTTSPSQRRATSRASSLRAPSAETPRPAPPPQRGAAPPQRSRRDARAASTFAEELAMGMMIEHMF